MSKKFSNAALLSAGFAIVGCGAIQNHSLVGNDGGVDESPTTQAFIEGFVEYVGPPAQWAGPASFILHVQAKDPVAARVTVSPGLYAQLDPQAVENGRVPASQTMTTDFAREHLTALGLAMEEDKSTFRGCMFPVRARLIRGDGSIVEKQGCRGQTAWTKSASALVHRLINASMMGQGKGAEQPAITVKNSLAGASQVVPVPVGAAALGGHAMADAKGAVVAIVKQAEEKKAVASAADTEKKAAEKRKPASSSEENAHVRGAHGAHKHGDDPAAGPKADAPKSSQNH